MLSQFVYESDNNSVVGDSGSMESDIDINHEPKRHHRYSISESDLKHYEKPRSRK